MYVIVSKWTEVSGSNPHKSHAVDQLSQLFLSSQFFSQGQVQVFSIDSNEKTVVIVSFKESVMLYLPPKI